MNKTLISAIGIAAALALAAPASAATAAKHTTKHTAKHAVSHVYYVGKIKWNKKCEVTTHKPNGKTVMMVGKSTYKTASAAMKALKAAPECKR